MFNYRKVTMKIFKSVHSSLDFGSYLFRDAMPLLKYRYNCSMLVHEPKGTTN